MATEILLTNERFVKSVTNISDNIAGKYLLPAIREAQEMKLKYILGQDLLSKLKNLAFYNEMRGSFCDDFDASFAHVIGANEHYRELIDQCQYYLAYVTVSELAYKVSYKVANFGISKGADENNQVASLDEIAKMKDYYQSKADACAIELQNFLLENRTKFPELSEGTFTRIRSNLYSAASNGIFLGGARGWGGEPRHIGWNR